MLRKIELTIAAILVSMPPLLLAVYPNAAGIGPDHTFAGVPVLVWGGFASIAGLGVIALIAALSGPAAR